MKVYIVLKDCPYCDGNIIGVFNEMKDAIDMRNSFGKDAEKYVIDTQGVIK